MQFWLGKTQRLSICFGWFVDHNLKSDNSMSLRNDFLINAFLYLISARIQQIFAPAFAFVCLVSRYIHHESNLQKLSLESKKQLYVLLKKYVSDAIKSWTGCGTALFAGPHVSVLSKDTCLAWVSIVSIHSVKLNPSISSSTSDPLIASSCSLSLFAPVVVQEVSNTTRRRQRERMIVITPKEFR